MSADPCRESDNPSDTAATFDVPQEEACSGLSKTGVGFLFWVEAILLGLTFAALAAAPVPGVNESHYWTKAKSFWDPSYCPDDLFLQSADAHLVFYWTLGWLVVPFTLPTAVWVARWIIWITTAVGWTYLSRSVVRPFGAAILSGGLMVVLNRWFHLAGEWVIGGAEAKGLAFACVFFSLGMACQRRWFGTWIWGGAAAAFHVLVGGWFVLCLMVATTIGIQLREARRIWKSHLLGMLIGGGLAMFGLLPGLTLNWGVPPEVANAGAEIYATQRIAHHLAIWAFGPIRILAFSALLVAWLLILNSMWETSLADDTPSHRERFADWPLRCLAVVSMTSVAIAAIGLIIGVGVLESNNNWRTGVNLLRFYWFRCSDVAVPLFVALGSFALVHPWSLSITRTPKLKKQKNVWRAGSMIVSSLAMFAIVTELAIYWNSQSVDPRPAADRMSLPGNMEGKREQEYFQNWLKVCRWIRQNTPEDSMFLTPRSQQTFKWYASRSEVVCWKDVPQDSASLLEWRRRAADCFPHTESEWGFAVNQPQALQRVIEKYNVDYLLIPQSAYELKDRFGRPVDYEMVYPASPKVRSTFVVLKTRRTLTE